MLEIWVKMGFQNKNKSSLGIIHKMTNGNIYRPMVFSHYSSEGPIQKLKKRNCFLGPKCNIQKSYQTHTHTHTYPKKKKQPQFEKAMVTFCPKKLNQRHLSLMAKFGYLA